ncbi:MAG TPA: glutathione S-transferase N-terminal domain-containing protein [Parvularculaceae bacterium]|nr:glutathione S-transferase N-terminal domain-containing protein [Parvularculaceae bacterium]
MTLTLYDLRTADPDIRPSPFCWIAKFALLHKGLDFETIPLGFAEKKNYPDPSYGKCPVLDDDGELVRDSAAIVEHLEKKYPARPLTATEGEKAMAEFVAAWWPAALLPGLGPLTMLKICNLLDGEDRDYFRRTREAHYGKSLEAYSDDPAAPGKVEAGLRQLAAPLARRKFLGGATPNLADYNVFSLLMWRRAAAPVDPYETPAEVAAWSERMLDLFGGYARKAKRAAA